MTPEEAIHLIRQEGLMLASAKGPVRNLAEMIAGEPVRGSWWAHPRGREIFAIFREIEESSQILVCRVVEGKITFVHRGLWPALIRLSGRFQPQHLGRIRQEHTEAGRHVNRVIPFPDWVPPDAARAAEALEEEEAYRTLGDWMPEGRQ